MPPEAGGAHDADDCIVGTGTTDGRNIAMRIVLISLVVLLALPFARAEDPGRIYVYAKFGSSARSWMPISCDGAPAAKLKHGNFFAVDLAPGRHVLGLRNGVPLFVGVRSGEDLFVRLDWRMRVGAPKIANFHVVGAALARKEMLGLRYIDANKVLSRLVPKSDPRPPPRLKTRGASHQPAP